MAKQKKFQPTFIRPWRHHRGLTLQELADRIKLTPSLVSMLERGRRGYSQPTLEAVASALQTDVASLLTREPTEIDDIGSIWDRAKPGQRQQLVKHAKTLVKQVR